MEGNEDISALNNTLRLLAKHRSLLIQNTLIQHEGLKVLQGPLAGMEFIRQSAEGCHIAKLLGCYEQPLLPYIKTAINTNYDSVINIGCAEGYYVVGMARKMLQTKFYAFDIDENSRKSCLELAKRNNVEDRVEIGSLFTSADFKRYHLGKSLIFCDIEGGEDQLLDPEASEEITNFDIIVEVHEFQKPGLIETLKSRFAQTHNLTFVFDNGQRDLGKLPQWFLDLSHLDQLLSVWEWRGGSTPWLIMTVK